MGCHDTVSMKNLCKVRLADFRCCCFRARACGFSEDSLDEEKDKSSSNGKKYEMD
jgi:hypothetical protein